jgi:hypothetical protein
MQVVFEDVASSVVLRSISRSSTSGWDTGRKTRQRHRGGRHGISSGWQMNIPIRIWTMAAQSGRQRAVRQASTHIRLPPQMREFARLARVDE